MQGPWTVAAAGMVSLAVAMGIGRFAFTPLLPVMLAEGSIDLPQASWLATANYVGYLAGAVFCMTQGWLWQRAGLSGAPAPAAMVRFGLASTVVLTLAMALPWPGTWALLRFAAGVASALVFVYIGTWCLGRLAEMGQAERGGAIYIGPGAGIVVSGLLATALVALGWSSAVGWALFAVMAAVLSASVWGVFRADSGAPVLRQAQDDRTSGRADDPAARAEVPTALRDRREPGEGPITLSPSKGRADVSKPHSTAELAIFWLAYGFSGFGYIITATFLPVIARAALPGSVWLDLFWPLVGFGVMVGALVATRISVASDLRLVLAGCYLVQAVAILLPVFVPTLGGFALGSFLLGLPFTAVTYFGMQETRRLRPHAVASTIGLMTVGFGLGQIAGPPMAATVLHASRTQAAGFARSLEMAAGAIVFGTLLYLLLAWRFPRGQPRLEP